MRLSCGAELERSQTEDYLKKRGAGSFRRLLGSMPRAARPEKPAKTAYSEPTNQFALSERVADESREAAKHKKEES